MTICCRLQTRQGLAYSVEEAVDFGINVIAVEQQWITT